MGAGALRARGCPEGVNEVRTRREGEESETRDDRETGLTGLFLMPGVGDGVPHTSTHMPSYILNPLQGGATGAEPLALARGSPLRTFSNVPTGRSLFLRLRGPTLSGSPTCAPAPWPLSPPAKLDALGVDSP